MAPPSRAAASSPSTVRRRLVIVRVVLLAGLGSVLAACVGGNVTTRTAPPTTDPGLALIVLHTPAGPVLATGSGYAIYAFGPDSPTHSTCLNAGCVYQWPPLITKGSVLVGPGVNRSLVQTLTRPGGAVQLSYGGHPLYTYILDVEPGVVTGQAIDQDGGPWYVVSPGGDEIRTPFTVNP
jgi:predicted lipoprotein with Yx(FWY)xxD motif